MKGTELLATFRSEMGDVAEPYFWSDAEIYGYADDAQKMFCRLSDGIGDGSTEAVTHIVVAQGATWLALHASILKIRQARRGSDGGELDLVNAEDLPARGIRMLSTPAPLRTVITGMEEAKLRLPCPAAAADSIELIVFRLPLAAVSDATKNNELEIPAQHHLGLLDWMKARALRKDDPETINEKRADGYEQAFRAYCTRARTEQGMKRHKGARVVAYGGI